MPFSEISPTSSGGVISNTDLIPSIIIASCSEIQSNNSVEVTSKEIGILSSPLLPLAIIAISSFRGTAPPRQIFRRSAVWGPTKMSRSLRRYFWIAASMESPPTFIDLETAKLPIVTTETSAAPPPTFTINWPESALFSKPTPMAEAKDSSTRHTRPAPARMATSKNVCFWRLVATLGTVKMTFGLKILFLQRRWK